MNEMLDIYVEMLDEGVETWLPTKAVAIGDGKYRILAPEDYNPEFDYLAFVPGDIVRLKEATCYDGTKGLLAIHPNPEAVRIWVESSEKHAPLQRETHALPLGNNLYRVLPTPHYTSDQLWKFPPDSVVRLKKRENAIGEADMVAVSPTEK